MNDYFYILTAPGIGSVRRAPRTFWGDGLVEGGGFGSTTSTKA